MNKFTNPPAPLWRDPTYFGLRIWSVFAMAGTVMFGAQGFAVTNGGVLPAAWVDYAVRWGAVLLALGCNGGTLAVVTEVCRRYAEHKAVRLDYIGVAISFVASVFAWLLALAPMQAFWAMGVLVITACADAYATYAACGLYKAEYAARMERWYLAKEVYNRGDWVGAWRVLQGAQLSSNEAQLRAQLQAAQLQAAQLQAQNRDLNAQLDAADAQLKAQSIADAAHPTDTRGAILAAYRRNPHATMTAVAQQVGVSRQRVSALLGELEAAGAIRRNGQITVLEGEW